MVGSTLQLRGLGVEARRLVRFGFATLLAACLLFTLVESGLHLPRTQISATIDIPTPFFWVEIAIFIVGWGYVLAAALGSRAWLRWSALAVFSFALLFPDIQVLRTAWAGPALAPDFWLSFVTVVRPELIALAVLWAVAIAHALLGRQQVTLVAVAGTTGTLVLYFALKQLLSTEDPLGGRTAVLEFVTFSSYLLGPLYTLAGIDLSEMLYLGARTVAGQGDRRLGPRAGLILGLLAAIVALAVEFRVRPASFRSPLLLLYTALWVLATLLVLRVARSRLRVDTEPSFPVLFWIVTAAYTIYVAFFLARLPGGLFGSLLLIGLVCLLVAAALVAAGRLQRFQGPILLLGVAGLWLVFQNVSRAVSGDPMITTDFFGATDPLVFSGVALLAITLAAERYPQLRPLRTVATVWTLVLVLLRVYVRLVLAQPGFPEAFAVIEFAVLAVLLAISVRNVPLRFRVAGVAMALAGLGASIVFRLAGGPPAMVALAQGAVLALAVLWDVLVSSTRVTNRDGHTWPRDSRVIGYLGYALVGLAVGLFYATAGGLESDVPPPSLFPAVGLTLLGIPVTIYVLQAAWVRAGEAAVS